MDETVNTPADSPEAERDTPAAERPPLTALERALFGLVKQQQACIMALAQQVQDLTSEDSRQ